MPAPSPLDLLLLLMAVIWGTNYVIVKAAFRELDPQAFNAVRLLVASSAFLGVMGILRIARRRRGAAGEQACDRADGIASVFHTPARITGREWLAIAALGTVGHVFYQFLFIGGLARTTVANSSLILASTPVVIAVMSAGAGQERLGSFHWLGVAVSGLGIYLVLGQGFSLGGAGLAGDLMTLAAVCCWAVYSLGARPLMGRHSPVGVTGLSMAFGTVLYVGLAWPSVRAVTWTAVSVPTLLLLVYSALFALCIAYTIWYVAVRQIGSARTAMYSNLVPVVAMLAAALVLAEPIGIRHLLGAAAVLAGVALTRLGGREARMPAEE